MQVGTDSDWAFVDAGYRHTVAVKTNRSLWTWGENEYGQLGNRTTTDANVPTRIR